MRIISGAVLAAIGVCLAAIRYSTPAPAQSQTCSQGTRIVCERYVIQDCLETGTNFEAGKWFIGFKVECTKKPEKKIVEFTWSVPPTTGGGEPSAGGTGDSGSEFGAGDPFDCGDPDLWSDDSEECSDFQEMS